MGNPDSSFLSFTAWLESNFFEVRGDKIPRELKDAGEMLETEVGVTEEGTVDILEESEDIDPILFM